MERVFYLIHLKYLAPMLSPGVMNYLIQQSMLSNTTSEQIIDGIWSTFVPPHSRRAGGLKHYFAQTLALMRPSHASRVLGNFPRLAILYAELKFREKFVVTSNSSFDTMTVRRMVWDGGAPRY